MSCTDCRQPEPVPLRVKGATHVLLDKGGIRAKHGRISLKRHFGKHLAKTGLIGDAIGSRILKAPRGKGYWTAMCTRSAYGLKSGRDFLPAKSGRAGARVWRGKHTEL